MEGVRHWRTRAARYSLVGAYCEACSLPQFPARPRCRRCRGETREHRFSGQGQVYSYAVVRQAPGGFAEQVPYPVALVALVEGPLVVAQLTDLEDSELRIGLPVEMVTRRLREDGSRGTLLYGYKFRPARGEVAAGHEPPVASPLR